MSSGVYQILNTVNDNRYIGSTVDIKRRWDDHKRRLLFNKHPNKHLQSAYNKYGIEKFIYSVILYCEKDDLIKNEQNYINLYSFENLYNMRKKADSNLGFIQSEDAKYKISLSGKGRVASEETRKKISVGKKGKAFSENHKKNLSISRKGKVASDETRRKIGVANKGRIKSEETRKKLSVANKSESSYGAKLTNNDAIKIKQMLISKKYTIKEIATKFNVSIETIRKIKILKSWVRVGENYNDELSNLCTDRGAENSGNAKLTNSDVIKIKQILVANKLMLKEIAEKFNVSIGSIADIKKLRTWVTVGEKYNEALSKL